MNVLKPFRKNKKESWRGWSYSTTFLTTAIFCLLQNPGNAQYGPPGGGSGGHGGSGGGAHLFNHIVEVTGSGKNMTVTWEFEQNYPQQNHEFEPYLVVYRGGAEILRKKLDSPHCTRGRHTLALDLGGQGHFSKGQHGNVFVYFDGWQPDVLGFEKSFIANSDSGDFESVANGLHNLVINESGWAPTHFQGCSTCQDQLTPQQGWIGPSREDFTERVVLYSPVTGGGCSSCGGSPIRFESEGFELQMRSLWDMASLPSLAGMGFYLDVVDSSGRLFMTNNQRLAVRLHNMPGICDVITMDQLQDNSVGELTDPIGFTKKCVVLGNANGNSNPTDEVGQARSLEVSYFNGSRLIYECVGTPDGSPDLEKDLRLTSIIDRCGRSLIIQYAHPTDRVIDTITDSFGNAYTFTFGPDIAGRPTVSRITFPNGTECHFEYSDNFLTKVSTPDWQWTADVTDEPATQTVCYATNHPTQGKRKYKLTRDFILLKDEILNQPASVCRSVETDYGRNLISMFQNPDNPSEFRVLRGSDQLSMVTLGQSEQFAVDFHIGNVADGFNAFTDIQGEPHFAYREYGTQASLADKILGRSISNVDIHGYSFSAEYDDDLFIIQRNYSDGTFEKVDRNDFKQITRRRDRLGRVTRYVYDRRGNPLERHEGILDIDGTDVEQAEFAVYRWEYYPENHVNACKLKTKFSPRNNGEADLYRIDFVYDTHNRLIQKIDAADKSGGERPMWTSTYYPSGLLKTFTDPVGRTATYLYDDSARIIQITYNDGSTDQTYYDPLVGKPKFQKNRNGIVTRTRYLSDGQIWDVVTNFGKDDDILDGDVESVENDINQQSVSVFAYNSANGRPTYSLINGNRSEFFFDYRGRSIKTRQYVAKGVFRDNLTNYDHSNRRLYSEDHWGRRTYYGYRPSDGEWVRTIVCAHDAVEFSNNESILDQSRSSHLNCAFTVTDAIKNLAGEITEVFDGQGIQTIYGLDSRGRQLSKREAVGTEVERKTESDFDLAGNVIEVRHPRYFDPTDPAQNSCKTNRTYNGRGLLASEEHSKGTTEARLTSYLYHLDGKQSIKIDPRGNEWRTDYHACCGRFLGSRNPLGHGSFSNTDFMGHVTHSVVVGDYDEHFADSHDPIDEKTYREQTQRFDGLGRVVAETQWVTPRESVDPNTPPIAGIDGVPRTDGYTRQVFHDNDLADGSGLDSPDGLPVAKLGGGSFSVSIAECLSKLRAPYAEGGAELEFESGVAGGSATVSIDPSHVIAVVINDGWGEQVMSATIESFEGDQPNQLVSWKCSRPEYQEILEPGFGKVVETLQIDAEGNTTRLRTDAHGWVVSALDANSNRLTNQYDSAGRLRSYRDANGVGMNVEYDELGRTLSTLDTYGDELSFRYDLGDNLVEEIDAKQNSKITEYNTHGQKIRTIDRVLAETIYGYDLNGNLETITDAEDQTTLAIHDKANQKIKAVFPDHLAGAEHGDLENGVISFTYNPAGDLVLKTDQAGDSCETVLNLAGVVTTRLFREHANTPNGMPNDTHTFVLDDAGRIVSASTSRFENTVTWEYDAAGRKSKESLTLGLAENSQSYAVSRTFDKRGQTRSLIYPDQNLVERTYTKQGWIDTISYDEKPIHTRSYDDGGRLLTSTFGNGVETSYSYRVDNQNKDDFIHEIKIRHNATSIDSFRYAYDENKNVVSESREGAMNRFSWGTIDGGQDGFDAEGRLLHWSQSDESVEQRWTVSPVGNWNSFRQNGTQHSFGYDRAHQLESFGQLPLDYDAKGNLTQNTNGHRYTWDTLNQLVGVNTDEEEGDEVSLSYDAFGRRVRKRTADRDIVYVSAGKQVLSEYLFGTSAATPIANYVYATYLDEPVLKDLRGPNDSRELQYFHCDRRFNVVAVSNENGDCLERYAYSPFGQITIADPSGSTRTSSDINNALTYTGRELDWEMGLYHFRSRYFDSIVGRFLSRDPMGYVDGMSLYSGYFAPSFLDPMGTRRIMGKTKSGSTVYWSKVLKSCVIDIPGPSGTMTQRPVQCPYRGGWQTYGKCRRSAKVLHKGKIRGGGFRNLDWKGELVYTCSADGNIDVSEFQNFWAAINKGSYLFNFPDSLAVGAGVSWGPFGAGVTRSWRGTIEYKGHSTEDVSCGDHMVKGTRVKYSANLRIYYDVALGIKISTFSSSLPNVEGSIGSGGSFLEYHHAEYLELIAYCCKCSANVCGVKASDENTWFDRTKSDAWQVHVIEDVRRSMTLKSPTTGQSSTRSMPETRW